MKTELFDPASSDNKLRKVVIDLGIGCREKEIKKPGAATRTVKSVAERLIDAGLSCQYTAPGDVIERPAGVAVFGKNGASLTTFNHVVNDLKSRGLALAHVNVIQRIKDGSFDRASLHFIFVPAGEVKEKEPFQIPEPAQKLVEEVLKRTFHYVHAFRNPNGSEVVLGLAPGDKPPLTTLRFDVSGEIVLEEVPSRPPKAKREAQAPVLAPAQEQPLS